MTSRYMRAPGPDGRHQSQRGHVIAKIALGDRIHIFETQSLGIEEVNFIQTLLKGAVSPAVRIPALQKLPFMRYLA